MHPRTTELLEHLERERASLRTTVNDVPADRHERAPAPGRWSVAEVVEHLSLVERRVTQLLAARLAEARARGLGPERETTPVLPRANVTRLLDRGTRLTASEGGRPRGGLNVSAGLAALDASRRDFHALMLDADGLALGEIVHPHPVFGPLDMYQWIAFVGGHEARHAAQIREISAQLDA